MLHSSSNKFSNTIDSITKFITTIDSIIKFITTINSCITNEKIIINENKKIIKL